MRGENAKIMKDKVLSNGEWNDDSNPNEICGRMFRLIKDITKEVFGEANGTRKVCKRTRGGGTPR